MTLESAVSPALELVVDGKKLLVDFSLKGIAAAEAKLGYTLRAPAAFYLAKAEDLPLILLAGLEKHHPEVTEDEAKGMCAPFGPEMLSDVIDAFVTIAFPRRIAEFKKTLEKGASPKE